MARTQGTSGVSNTSGAAVSRSNYDPSAQTLEQWMTDEVRRNPGYRVPNGYEVDSEGTVTRTQPAFLYRHPWLIPLLGVGGGLGLAAAGVGGGVAAGGAAGSSGAAPAMGGGSTLATNLGGASALPSATATTAGATTTGATAAGTAGAGSTVRNVMNRLSRNVGGDGETDWMRVLAPLLGLGATAVTGGFNTPNSGMDPGIQKQIEALIARQNLRGEKSEPIYDAAMRLAGNLAPASQNNPRLQEAIRDAGSPLPQRQMDPQVAEAYARLMGGR